MKEIIPLLLLALGGAGGQEKIRIIPQVETEEGFLEGAMMLSRGGREFSGFRGVRYAEKPERFEVARPLEKWEGVRNATEKGSPCLQAFPGQVGSLLRIFGDEDCLFINVYTAHKNQDKTFPVMVFLHGGAFTYGSGNQYGPEYLTDENVVLVTVNYRLGALGFLYNEDERIPGNLGLKDQLEALRWIERNIHHFGGDFYNVTLFGQSAGAASAYFHILSPLSRGKFHKVIAQSGTGLCPWAVNTQPRWLTRRFSLGVGCPVMSSQKMVECLKKLDARRIIEEQTNAMRGPIWGYMWAPVVEVDRGVNETTAFLMKHPTQIIDEGSIPSKVPLLLGVVKNEGVTTLSSLIRHDQNMLRDLNSNWSSISPLLLLYGDRYQHHPRTVKGSAKIREFYFGSYSVGQGTEDGLTNLFSDRYFVHPVQSSALAHSDFAPTYAYLYTFYDGFSLPHLYGHYSHDPPTHSDELPYIFSLGVRPVLKTKVEMEFSRNLVKLWASFAAKGTPEALWGSAQQWLPVNRSDKVFMWYRLDRDTQVIMDPFYWRMKFWDHLLATDLHGLAIK